MATYGYCRVSTHSQRIERQESNILEKYPQAVIYKEAFSGRGIYPVSGAILQKHQPCFSEGAAHQYNDLPRLT